MKKINVEVSENASIAEISGKIAKQLMKAKQLEYKSNQTLLIGNGGHQIEVIENGLQINVTRKIGKHDELKKCHCGIEYMKSSGFKYRNNYGGVTKTATVCSANCFELIKHFCGDRVAPLRRKLNPIIKAPYQINQTNNYSHSIKNGIQIKKTDAGIEFYKNEEPFIPTLRDLKSIYLILKLI